MSIVEGEVYDPKVENRDKYKRIANNVWWIILTQGVVVLLVGLFILLEPAFSATFVAQIAGIYLIVTNTLSLLQWVLGITRHDANANRSLLVTVLGLIIGIVIALVPSVIAQLVAQFIFLFVGIGLVLYGVFHLIQASMSRYVDSDSSRNFILGIVWLIVGLLVMVAPIVTTRIILAVLGVAGVGAGAGFIYFAFYLRRLGREIVRQIDVEIEREAMETELDRVPVSVPLRPTPEG
ncbi:MAG: DUF308 domain-containing protein [Anaerolineales bacterium]|nr:DUF308 domain-containing protein [Anaerolineales bacterium]